MQAVAEGDDRVGWLADLFDGSLFRGRRGGDSESEAPRVPLASAPVWRRPADEPRPATLPRFRASATEQLHGVRGGPLAEARVRLRDAFTPSQPVVDPTMFAGRDAVLATLIRSIEDQKLHVVLFGDRGIGKTSLLHVLAQQAGEARYLVHYASCGEESEFGEIFRSVAADIPLLFHGGYSPSAVEIEQGRTLADLLPPDRPVTARVVSDLFAKLTGTRLLVILDEFDRSAPGPFRREIAELVKTLSDRSVRAQLVIAGVASNLTDLVEHIPSIRRNILGLPVPNMAPDEIEALVRNGERVSGLSFLPAAVASIVSIASGSPYLASLLGQHAGISAVDRGATTVDDSDVAVALDRAVAEIADRISERSRFEIARAAQDGQGKALAVMARAALREGGRFDERVLGELLPEPDQRQAAIEVAAGGYGLIERLPDDHGARYRFREEGVPVYLWMEAARIGLLT